MPCYGNIPEGDEIVAYWADDERVAIFNLLDDIGQPYSCTNWGDVGTAQIPIIIDDGVGHTFHDLFELVLDAYPVNVFLDHEMNVVNITEAEMNQTAVNNVIQDMLDNISGNCTAGYDCNGDCGGTAVYDECDECGGDGIDEGACDCSGNVLDACGVCDGDGESCIGCMGWK